MRSQQHISTMVNAMVSHELRNPLNALLGQLLKIQGIRSVLSDLIRMLMEKRTQGPMIKIEDILQQLHKIN